jgi:hypothetical protein
LLLRAFRTQIAGFVEVNMKRIGLAGRVLGFALILGAASLGLPHYVAAAPPGALKALDTDNDGTVDLAETRAAAKRASKLPIATMMARWTPRN